MRLLLIRHGQTPSNVAGRLDTAVPGPGLTELGLAQAAAIPRALEHESIGTIFASTQLRAQLTATPLAESLDRALTVRDGIREIDAGELEMRNDWDAVMEYHRASFAWVDGQLDERVPGGENGHDVFGRFDAVVDEAAALGDETVAIVAHGQVLRVWAAARTRATQNFAAENPLHNTGMIVVDGTPGDWSLVEWRGEPLGGENLDVGISGGPGGTAEPVR
ncbi:histidine phosphatase family protein [Paramicrobacterium agarici]|uniref:Putative phosphoglycerate mutase n=1 Tax=Paramicrobacterium agarici TaxID=630514 RepID=A0A2A9DXT8_9MICO|nr:histidine phosphatase family protein [Microbacterium agarici]PFG30812.1 putative phosphoglycerate mutase [Microbacterium agarici]TQO23879.1 putative phosphoglycerate mutase [Microbacterium agarici]